MTLEQLRPILAAYNTPGAVLRVLELGLAMTAVQLVEATGKQRQRVYVALADLKSKGFVTKTGQAYLLAESLSRKRDNDCHESVTDVSAPDSDLSRKRDNAGGDLSRKRDSHENVTGENTDQEPVSRKRDNEKSPLLLSINSLSINSLKEQDLKDKLLKKPGAKKIESSAKVPAYDPLTDPQIPAWIPRDLWADFCAHRQGIKHPITALAVKNLATQLEGWRSELGSGLALEALRASIANGWRGVFKPKSQSPPRRLVTTAVTAKERDNWSEEEWLR